MRVAGMTKIEKFHIQEGRLVKVPEELLNEFADGDCYLVDTGPNLYLWIGANATADEKFVGTLTSATCREERKDAHLITIDQGEEPQEFLDLFGGKINITQYDTEGILRRVALKQRAFKLFRVHIDKEVNLYQEVACVKTSLTSDDVYLLDTFNKIFIWRGSQSTEEETTTAMVIARKYDAERIGEQEIILVEEGEETQDFLDALR